MSTRFVRKGQGRPTVLMGHVSSSVIGGDGLSNEISTVFQGGQVSGVSTFDPSGINKSIVASNGEPFFWKVENGVPQWAVFCPSAGFAGNIVGARVSGIVALSDGGCLVGLNFAFLASRTVDVQNGDGTTFVTLDPASADPQLVIDSNTASTGTTNYVARYDSDGNGVWIKRHGANNPGVVALARDRGLTGVNMSVDEDAGLVFVQTGWRPNAAGVPGPGGTLGVGFGEASPLTYTTTTGRNGANVNFVLNLADGTYAGEGDYARNSLSNLGFSYQLDTLSRSPFKRQTLAGERITSAGSVSPARSNPSPSNDVDAGVNSPAVTSFIPQQAADRADQGVFMAYYADGDQGPTWEAEHTLRGPGVGGSATPQLRCSGVRLGATQVFGGVSMTSVDPSNLFVRYQSGTNASSDKFSIPSILPSGLRSAYLYKVDKSDGDANYAVEFHAEISSAAQEATISEIILLDESRDLLVCAGFWDAANAGTIRYNVGNGDHDVSFVVGDDIQFVVFFRASTLQYLSNIQFSNVAFARPNESLSPDGSRLLWPIHRNLGVTVLDFGGPNAETLPATPSLAQWGTCVVDLDTLAFVPGSYQAFYDYSTVGVTTSPNQCVGDGR